MKKLLLLPLLALLLAAGCTSMEDERDTLLNTALGLEEKGDFAEARAAARKSLDLDPGFGLGYLLLGRCDMEEKNLDGALTHFTRAYELMPDNLEAVENLARISLIRGNLPDAEKYAAKGFALSPASTEITIIRAGIFMHRQDYEQAKPLLEKVLQDDPDNEEAIMGLATIAINQGETDKAKEILKDALSRLQKPSPAILSMLTAMALQDNDLASAETFILRLMEVADSDEQLALHLAELYQDSGREQEALPMLRGYLEKHPEALAVRTRLAEMTLAQGKLDEAVEIVNTAPGDTPAVKLLRASVLTQIGKVEEAIPALRSLAADSKTDKDTAASAQIGLASIYLQQNKAAEAEKELTALIEREPDNAQALFMRGGIHFNARNYAKALADMERVVEVLPNDPAAYLGMADVHNAAGNAEQAEKIISDVIARFPQYASAYTTLANLHMMRNKPEAALMTLNIGKEAIRENVELVLAESDILISLKRYDEAKALLDSLATREEYAVVARLRLAEMYIARESYTQAARVYETLLKENPDLQGAVQGYIQALVSGKKIKEAVAFAEQRQAKNPDDAMAAYLLAETALVNNDAAKAEKALLRALELEPLWEPPLTRLVQLYSSSGRLDEALKLCEGLIEKHPDATGPAVLRGILLEQHDRLEEAETQYRAVLEKQENNLLAANNLAYVLARHKNTPERLKEAEALALSATLSGAPATFDTLGWVQHLLGKREEAEKSMRRAYEDLRDNPTVTFHMASVLAASGDKTKINEAVKLLEKITGSKSEPFPQAKEAKTLLDGLKKK